MRALAQNGKHLVNFACRPRPPSSDGPAEKQVFLHGEVSNDAPALRYDRESVFRGDVGPRAVDRMRADANRSAPHRRQSEYRIDDGGLADAVAADQRHAVPGVDMQAQFMEDVRRAVAGVDLLQSKELAHAALPR